MRERKQGRHQAQKLDSPNSGSGWNGISTVHWTNKLAFVSYIHLDDRRTRTRDSYITYKELSYNITIVCLSAAAFGLGLGQCLAIIF